MHIEPNSFKVAFTGDDATHWKRAVDSKFQSLCKSKTWVFVQKPPSRKGFVCKCLDKVQAKQKSDGYLVTWYRARLAACEYSEVDSVDISETYGQVEKYTSIRIWLR